MKKMPCLFVRTFHGKRSFTITEQVTPGCEWVLENEGIATRKWDGSACAVIDGTLYKRYDAKRDPRTGEYRKPPNGAIPCSEPDAETGHWPHWVFVGGEPESKWHILAWKKATFMHDGTYELCGPHFQGNPYGFLDDMFIRHGVEVCGVDRTFEGIRAYLECDKANEGLVFHHPDGRRMCKIRRNDFGFAWPPSAPFDE